MRNNGAPTFYKGVTVAVLGLFLLTGRAGANSSWMWLTTSPLPVFPLAVIATLLVETLLIKRATSTRTEKVLLTVSLANLFSFIVPYLARAYQLVPTQGRFSVPAAFERGPFYIVATGYLVLTLVLELPVVYLLLARDSARKARLALTIIAVNILTTGLVALAERLICRGGYA